MDWTAPIDLYCERLGPGLWGEPLNATSNVAFLLAAGIGFAAAVRSRVDAPTVALSALVALIGIGSFLFHAFADRWSVLADVGPITLFIFAYLGLALRRFLRLGWPTTGLLLILFPVASWPIEAVLRPVIATSAGYVPALLAMFAIGAILGLRGHRAGPPLLAASGIFLLSLTLRTLDQPLCDLWPAGTHFAWHILNATTLATLLVAAARHGRPLHFRGEARQNGGSPLPNGPP